MRKPGRPIRSMVYGPPEYASNNRSVLALPLLPYNPAATLNRPPSEAREPNRPCCCAMRVVSASKVMSRTRTAGTSGLSPRSWSLRRADSASAFAVACFPASAADPAAFSAFSIAAAVIRISCAVASTWGRACSISSFSTSRRGSAAAFRAGVLRSEESARAAMYRAVLSYQSALTLTLRRPPVAVETVARAENTTRSTGTCSEADVAVTNSPSWPSRSTGNGGSGRASTDTGSSQPAPPVRVPHIPEPGSASKLWSSGGILGFVGCESGGAKSS